MYFDRECKGITFGEEKPCLCLKSVCWMNPWALIENVTIPVKKSKLNLFFYHYIVGAVLPDIDLLVYIVPQQKCDSENV
jgi:hypothetical protein